MFIVLVIVQSNSHSAEVGTLSVIGVGMGLGGGKYKFLPSRAIWMPVVCFYFVSVSLPHSGNRLDHVFLFDFNRL